MSVKAALEVLWLGPGSAATSLSPPNPERDGGPPRRDSAFRMRSYARHGLKILGSRQRRKFVAQLLHKGRDTIRRVLTLDELVARGGARRIDRLIVFDERHRRAVLAESAE